MRVVADALGRVALRVYRNEQHAGSGRLRQGGPVLLSLRQLREGHRADIRAMGEAQRHQGPVSAQFTGHQRGAIGLPQVEGGQLARRLEQANGGGLRTDRGGRWREHVLRCPQPERGGQGDDKDDSGGAIEHDDVRGE